MPDLLEKYRRMRDFSGTPEPAGGKPKKGKLPIFVIQMHAATRLHYDFRLEMEGVLKSWAIPKGPSYDPATKRLAMMTEDHPYDYASFEGVIPEGNYGAGNVILWDTGQWELVEPGDDPVAALKSGKLAFKLYGKKMFGEWALVRIKGRGRSDRGNEWLLLKHRDEFANDTVDVTEVAPRSVISNKLVKDGGENVWESNRKAPSTRPPTLADRLAKSSSPVVKSSSPKTSSAGSKTRRLQDSSTRSPSPKAGARTGSSRAAATKKARTIARHRPR